MAHKLELELEKTRHALSAQDLAAALRPVLASRHGIELVSLKGEPATGVLHGQAKAWVPLQRKELGPLEGVHVSVPVEIELRLERGRAIVIVADPAPADLAEAASFVTGLVARGQVVSEPGKPMAAGATHRVEVDVQGRRLLKRSRFSAVGF